MRKRTLPTVILAFILLLPGLGHTQSSTAFPRESTSQQNQLYQSLTPAQRQAVAAEAAKRDGVMTPEDVIKGRELLEKGQPKPSQTKETGPPARIFVEEAPKQSLFDRTRNLGSYQDISLDLQLFGYDFFREAAVRVVTERRDIPIPMQYLVGPGDEVRILLWGRMNEKYNLVVDRDGKITVPVIGPIAVAGMTFGEMSKKIIDQAGQITGTNVDVSMGSLRTIPIFVLGDVKRPGNYTIGSLATITDALLLAGGPTEIGSMRRIELKRKDRLIVTFDLYDLLLKGDKSKDVVLQGGDVVFVPVSGPHVGIAGNVKRPAIYELKDRKDLQDLMDMAGGIIPAAYTQQIQIDRIIRNEKQVVVDIDDKNLTGARDFALQDADLVKVFSIVDIKINTVYLNGNVKRPGKYEMKDGMRLGDLIKSPDDLLSETYFDYALIKRLEPPDMKTVLVPVNLGKLLLQKDETSNVELKPRDSIYVFNRGLFKDSPFVKIEGEIRGDCASAQDGNAPGGDSRRTDPLTSGSRYTGRELTDQTTRLQRPEMTDQAIMRPDRRVQKLAAIGEELKKQGLVSLAKSVKDIEDEVITYNAVPEEKMRNLRVELIKVGRPDLANQILDVEQIVKKGGSLADVADKMRQIEDMLKKQSLYDLAMMAREIQDEMKNFGRVPTDNMRILRAELIKVNMPDLASQILEIENRTKISCNIPFVDNMRIKDTILIAGGLTSNSYLDRAEIIRSSDKREYQTLFFNLGKAMAGDLQENLPLQSDDRIVIHSIWEQVFKKNVLIDGDVAKPGSHQYTEGMTVRDLVFKGGSLLESAYLGEAEITSMVVVAGKSVTSERRVINLGRSLAGDPQQNVVLRPNDRLLVKRIPNWDDPQYVTLTGEFKFPGKYAVQKGEKMSSVIERAGGYTSKAYLRGAVFTRTRVRELQQQSLTEVASRMERELLSSGSASVATALSAEEIRAKEVELAQKQKLVQKIRELKATGRMTIRLAHLRLLKGSEYDIELENSDQLHIPQANSVVNVSGAVMTQGSYIFMDRYAYEDYIAMTGGYTSYADGNNTFVLKVDGSARRLARGMLGWNAGKSRWELASFGEPVKEIEPGDTIIVPEKVERIAWLREIRDITQILMQLAVTAGVTIKLF